MFGVYEAYDYAVRGSAFNVTSHGDRTARTGGADNLLRQNTSDPTFWIELDSTGASTFILNAEAIDITKSTVNPIVSFATGKYVIEASVFGFGRKSFDLTQPFQLAISSDASLSYIYVPPPNSIIPAPLRVNDTVLINYSRTPYQGDPWGSQTSFSDLEYLEGPLTSPTAFEIASKNLTNPLSRPNQKPLEVLASVGFITTLGTGRFSGDFTPPNVYDFRNVGYEDPTGPNVYPPPSAGSLRPITKPGAIGSSVIFSDLEANPEYLGCTTRLPLGSLYRDKDFKGGRFSDDFASPLIYTSNAGVGSGVASLGGATTLDQIEVLATPASVSAGLPGDVLVHVDGEQDNYTSLTNFRTARGGSVFVGSGDHPGGELFATYERILGSVNGVRALVGRAFLVRNAPTIIGGNQVSAGDELMLAVATQVMELGTTPSEAMILLGTNGSGEGYSAADLYRIEGHPLLANHTFYNVDPSTVVLPVGKTISQITDPPDITPFPMGAPDTVYASNGSYNFWSNAPTLTSLTLTTNLIFSATDPFPNILQAAAAPGVAGTALQIINQKITPTASTGVGFSAAPLILATDQVNSSSPGWNGSSGQISIGTGTIDANTVGNTGDVIIGCGANLGTGNGGDITLVSGNAFGTSGHAGQVFISGGTAINGSNPSGNAGDVVLTGGHCGTIAGNGGNIHLNAGSGPTDGYVDVLLGSSVIQYAKFTNLDLILGPATGTGNYGIQFSAGTTNPTIGQDNGTGFAALLTIKSQNAGGLNTDGGDIKVETGSGTGSGATGVFSVSNGFRNNLRVSANDTESLFFDHNTTELGDGNYSDVYSLTFSSLVIAPKFGQKATPGPGETLTIKAADVSSVFGDPGKGGDLRLEGGNGLGASNNGGDIILMPGTPGSGGTTGSLAFDALALAPLITQKDAISGSGKDLTITAQATPVSGFSGGNLFLNGGNGDFTGGAVELSGGGATGGTGGAIILSSGVGGTAPGEINLRIAGFQGLVLDTNGLHIKQGGGPQVYGLTFAAANPVPSDTVDDGGLYVDLSTKHLNYVSSIAAYGIRKISANIRIASVKDVHSVSSGAITSTTYVDVISPLTAVFTVEVGDIIEGEAYLRVITDATFGQETNLKVTLTDGSAPEDFELFFNVATAVTQGDAYTLPIYYTATVAGTITVTLQLKSVDGTTSIQTNDLYTSSKWLSLRQIRP